MITTGGKIRGDFHFHIKFLCIVSSPDRHVLLFFNRGGFLGPCSASVALRGLSLVVVSRGYSSLRWLLLLRSTSSRVLRLSSGGAQA